MNITKDCSLELIAIRDKAIEAISKLDFDYLEPHDQVMILFATSITAIANTVENKTA